MKISLRDIPFLLLSFAVPFICYYLTSSHSLMFDDAGEFALVIKLGSIAHPPGTPSFILAGMIWNSMMSLFGMNTIDALTLFSALCVSISSLLLCVSFRTITKFILNRVSMKEMFVCCMVAVGFATAATTWAWANTVEVYAFQLLTLALTFFGLTHFHFYRKTIWLVIAGFGIASGLGNHHLTIILFLPFTPLFFLKQLFVPRISTVQKKKTATPQNFFLSEFFAVLKSKSFLLLAGISAVLTTFFYAWMFYRAQSDYPFMFGQPNTFGDLIYQISGGSYSKNISGTSKSIISARIPYFLKLTFFQLFTFLPVFILGIYTMFSKKLLRVAWMVIIYFVFLFIYQINNDQWSSTDAYMLLPFFILSVGVFYGAIYFADKMKTIYVLPVLVIIQIIYNYPSHDRRTYPVSESLMDLLDKSAPKNSIILISDWSTVIQYYYYRIAENFRPDLTVLNYDIKFTHYKILPTLYPAFYQKIKPEYDYFISELTKEHPHQAVNTGCDLSTRPLSNAFKALLNKIEALAKSENISFLTDPRAHYFYSTEKFYEPGRYVSGCFSSSVPGDTTANNNFLRLDFPFLHSKLIYDDPAALDKLVDFQAMLDRHIDYYLANNDTIHLAMAEPAKDKILRMQREMKKSMSFAYKMK